MSAGEQTDEEGLPQSLLTDDEMVEIGFEPAEEGLRVGDLLRVGRCRCGHAFSDPLIVGAVVAARRVARRAVRHPQHRSGP